MFTKTIEYTVLPSVNDSSRQIFIDPSGHAIPGLRRGETSHRTFKDRVRGAQLQTLADNLGLYESMKLLEHGTMTVEYHFGIARRVEGTCDRITF